MASPRIPASAPQDLKEVLRDLWAHIDRILGGRNVDWHGRRIINAGDAVDPQDYVTLGQVGTVTTEVIRRVIEETGGGSGSGSGGPKAPADASYLTLDNERSDLPNSARVVAGPGIEFEEFNGVLTISAAASASADHVVLSDGVAAGPSPVDDGAGNFIYVGYTP